MATIVKQGRVTCWVDPDGVAVPEKYINEGVKKRDKMVESALKEIKLLRKEMARVKAKVEAEVLEYLDEIAESYGEDWKGNAQLSSFDGKKVVMVKVNKIFCFDERLQVAKTKIDKCISKWSAGASAKLIAVVNHAFAVDEKGKVDRRRILSLQKLKIDDPDWKEAMDIINSSITTEGTRRYIGYLERDEETDELQQILLNYSAI